MLPLLLIIIACILWAEEINNFIQEKYSEALDAIEDVIIALAFYCEKVEHLTKGVAWAEERERETLKQITELRNKHKNEVELLNEQIRRDLQSNLQKYRQALRINNESLEQVLADCNNTHTHLKELINEKGVLERHQTEAWDNCKQAWSSYNSAEKLAEIRQEEIEWLNTVRLDLTQQLVAYENWNLYKSSLLNKAPFTFMSMYTDQLLPANNFNLSLEKLIQTHIPGFYSYKVFYNIFIVKYHNTQLFTIAFHTFEEPGLGSLSSDVGIYNYNTEVVREETGFI